MLYFGATCINGKAITSLSLKYGFYVEIGLAFGVGTALVHFVAFYLLFY